MKYVTDMYTSYVLYPGNPPLSGNNAQRKKRSQFNMSIFNKKN